MNIPESADGNYASPPAGLYAPVPSFFKGEWAGDPDEAAAKRHFDRLFNSGVSGLILHSHHGESPHLAPCERKIYIPVAVASACKHKGKAILVDCSAPALGQVVERLGEAKEGGAGWAVVGLASQYPGEVGEEGAMRFFEEVCSWSKLPILISSSAPYHLLSSAILARLVLTPKIIGILTPSPLSIQPLLSQAGGEDLRLFSTSLWAPTIPSTMEEGVVSPLVNLAPRLAVDSRAKGACRRVQDALGKARAMEEEGGVVDLKYALNRYSGYGGHTRSPLPPPSEAVKQRVSQWLDEVMYLESELEIGRRPEKVRADPV